MKRLFHRKFHYPKIIILVIVIIASYFIFSNPNIQNYILALDSLKSFGTFIAGVLFAFGFTAPLAAGYFIVSNPANIWVAVIVGGIGSAIGDLILFKIIRTSFIGEFESLEKTHIVKKMNKIMEKELGHRLKAYLLYAVAGILIASPLPDEIGVIMLAGLTHIKARYLAIISFILHAIGIYILLLI